MPSAEGEGPIIHAPGCGWETGPHCTCGADPERSAEIDAAVAEALARYAPMIWEAGRNAGVLDAMREHGPSDEQGRLMWIVMTPRTEENPYEGVPFDFAAHNDTDPDGQALAECYRAAMSAKRELTPDDEAAIADLLTRDIPPAETAVERCRRLHGLEPGYVMGCEECERVASLAKCSSCGRPLVSEFGGTDHCSPESWLTCHRVTPPGSPFGPLDEDGHDGHAPELNGLLADCPGCNLPRDGHNLEGAACSCGGWEAKLGESIHRAFDQHLLEVGHR